MTDTKTIAARHGFAWERSEDLPEIERDRRGPRL